MEKMIYHICTKGLADKLWFFDDEDYVAGMNAVPVCASEYNVSIYCFCLMSNHVHFIVRGEAENCVKFIREYKRLRSLQLNLRYKDKRSIAGSDIVVKPIIKFDYLKTAVAYVMRNPLAAGIAVMPSEYRWSSSNLYFADKAFNHGVFRKLGDLSQNRKRHVIKSKLPLPDEYLIDCDNVVFPGSYVDYRAVEGIYGSPKRLLFYLSSTNDMEVELETGILKKTSYRDSELLASMEVICEEKFHGRKFAALKIEDRYLVAREMRKKYGAGPKQLARITSLDYESLKQML